MSRSDSDPRISFVRAQDGLSLILESKKWKLDRGKSYPVHLTAGSRSVNATAVAETNSVNITLADTKLNSRLRSANNLQLHVKGTMLQMPLHSSSIAFERLEECFNTGEAPERNALKRKASERKWSVASGRKR